MSIQGSHGGKLITVESAWLAVKVWLKRISDKLQISGEASASDAYILEALDIATTTAVA